MHRSEVLFELPLILHEQFNFNQHSIVVICGQGRGIVRTAIIEVANASQYVDRYEFLHPNLGGTSAIQIYFKLQSK